MKTYCGYLLEELSKALLMSTHNICFCEELAPQGGTSNEHPQEFSP